MKKSGIIILILLLAAGAAAYFFRFEIFQVSAENIIKKNLPPFISVDTFDFDLKSGILTASGVGIKNPGRYRNRYLAHIDTVVCAYKMRGKQILDGIEITDIKAAGVVINIERLPDGRINVNEMEQIMGDGRKKPEIPADQKNKTEEKAPGMFDISNLIKLTETINIKNGQVNFIDCGIKNFKQYGLTVRDARAKAVIRLNRDYTGVLSVGATGTGNINGDSSQRISWVVYLDPGSSALTMSNRIEASNLDITLFKPYYDQYAPVEIDRGRFSGTIVLDFDNGNIGSMNTLRLSDLRFRQKTGFTGAVFWDVALPDIIKYLQSSPGEITFDFKIKGSMENPMFYPGPVVKEALQQMTVDKISRLFQSSGSEGEETSGGASDADKVFDAIKGFLDKK
ncbi:MAG: DUF748 domain-containing protein [Candidatus Omnitrophica bacterium]|nr:DUF748 domain-containing protein [Candidatus Omnitrophota bacterium]MBU1127846.1 DUF748 domain-containing protein [Candidatus Omnitrophota bacterium]MBU1657008.1 DUF748 domain-containing protein [Candidatus Omnitrophota bacterium]MBU1784911.1 DUF748 domain-containing protein [Candidatus Omnitrophota bacterium]MBU1852083.1 DUF748 domain-containing protein [Candidatus Omnitrophota bacterium]